MRAQWVTLVVAIIFIAGALFLTLRQISSDGLDVFGLIGLAVVAVAGIGIVGGLVQYIRSG